MSPESAVHLLEADRRRRREEQWQKWERERRLRESEASRLRELERHRPARVTELPPSALPATPPPPPSPPPPPPPMALAPPPSSMAATPASAGGTSTGPGASLPSGATVPSNLPLIAGAGATLLPSAAPAPAPPLLTTPVAPPRPSAPPSPLVPRRFGGPVQNDDVRRLLAMDAAERFDLVELNALPLVEISRESFNEEAIRVQLRERSRALLERVKQETDDLAISGAFFRGLVLQWYRESPTLSGWSTGMPERWGGLFADSRAAGGRLQPWLVRRLLTLAHGGHDAPPLSGKLLKHLGRGRKEEHYLERPPAQTWAAEAAQAILDDLALHPHVPGAARIALVRLSELAQRRQVENINQALGLLLDGPERGPFVLLHPNRYPDCELVTVRPPPPGSSGAALSYTLHLQRLTLPAAVPGVPATEALAAASSSLGAEGVPAMADGGNPWEAQERTSESWGALLRELARAKQHLPPPPKDYRQRAVYRTLRDVVVSEPVARASFHATRWRGRPSGLLLLSTLLTEGHLEPEVSTDYEYLDSELSDLEDGKPERMPDPPQWKVPGGTVVREGDFQRGYRYRFTRQG
ncbi:MAG: hypothetical protein KGJ23_12870 [Euryarchaeota archaeon]|nr:hypothetical protein [Euryarchaeota archaeon]MDE1837492.1 hypothetical protein [Euryarchaeota archaeon]MDE1880552.1 hypothetical protein [Euryarchaeota archaeon]MDE2045542.1 hypothetical protein [Thermoplasmata archaeon]